jgi:hypothetical protein
MFALSLSPRARLVEGVGKYLGNDVGSSGGNGAR